MSKVKKKEKKEYKSKKNEKCVSKSRSVRLFVGKIRGIKYGTLI